MQFTLASNTRVVASYVFDYLIIVFLIIAFSALDKAEPFHQRFSVHNTSLQYPFAVKERVPPWLAAVVACGFPLVVIILWTLVIDGLFSHKKKTAARGYSARGVYTLQQRIWQMNAGILGLGLSVAAAVTIAGALKNLTGKPRPDVLDRCKLEPNWVEPNIGLTSWTKCTGNPILLRDGFKSWPSGHSSTAFAGLGYFSLWLAGKLHIMDNRGEVWKTVIVLIPLLAASMIAISRIMDARHHPFDVVSSSILGMFVAWVSYRQYFPSLYETWNKGRAHPMRSWGSSSADQPNVEGTTAGLIRDEEEGKVGYTRGSLTGDEAITGIAGQRRRQYLEEQEILERNRRRTHEFYDAYTGPTTQAPALTDQPTASYNPQVYEEPDMYEMRDRNGARPTETAYKPYGSSSVARAVEGDSDDGFVQVKPGSRGLDDGARV